MPTPCASTLTCYEPFLIILPYLLGGYALNNLNSHKIRQNSIKNSSSARGAGVKLIDYSDTGGVV
jgi:hypothetical protein